MILPFIVNVFLRLIRTLLFRIKISLLTWDPSSVGSDENYHSGKRYQAAYSLGDVTGQEFICLNLQL